jgi:hypothetical protein
MTYNAPFKSSKFNSSFDSNKLDSGRYAKQSQHIAIYDMSQANIAEYSQYNKAYQQSLATLASIETTPIDTDVSKL